MKGMNVMKRCPNCGEYIDDSDRFCSKCGKEVVEVVDTIVVSEDYNGDDYTKEQMLLRDQYSRRASNALTLSIVSIVLCCCSITAIISLIFSITLIFDMKKLSPEIKSTIEYNKIKNKNFHIDKYYYNGNITLSNNFRRSLLWDTLPVRLF